MFKNKQYDGQAIDTLVGPQVTLHGDLVFSGGLYVEGRIYGRVIAEDGKPAVLTLAEQGRIEGEVQVPVVVLNGELQGDIYASERVELAAKARVLGNVHYKVVEMRAGATLTGRLIHVDAEAGVQAAPTLVAANG
ncbi:MAG: polymer-forming cytoskeletal protein [Pseudoxanthomonas sp.]